MIAARVSCGALWGSPPITLTTVASNEKPKPVVVRKVSTTDAGDELKPSSSFEAKTRVFVQQLKENSHIADLLRAFDTFSTATAVDKFATLTAGQIRKTFQRRKIIDDLQATLVHWHHVAMCFVVDFLFIPSDEEVSSLQGNFAPVEEIGEKVAVQVIQGEVPLDFPAGCFLRNGPNPRFGSRMNLQSPFGGWKTLYSWFEGDGMLHAVYFERDGSIWYKNKYVETESYKLETSWQRQMYLPTMDEHSTPGARFNRLLNLLSFGQPLRNPGNTSVFEHAGHVVAAVEGGSAYEINLDDLSTVGEYNCNGHWKRQFFGPHPKILPDSRELVVYGFAIKKPYWLMNLISPDGKEVLNSLDLGLERLVLMHDIGVTDKYMIVYDFPAIMDVVNMVLRGKSIITMEPSRYSRIGVVPLKGKTDSIKWFNVNTAFITHHCNSYEDGDEVVVHAVVTKLLQILAVPRDQDKLDWYARGMTLDHLNNYETKDPSIDGGLFAHIHEWRLNMKTGAVTERDITQREFSMEHPKINETLVGKKYRYCYVISEDVDASIAFGYPRYRRLVKIDVSSNGKHEVHDLGENVFLSEPSFVPRPGATEEDDGWLVSYVHDESTNESDVVIIDAQNFQGEPVARIRMPQRVPYGFHGTYIPYQ